MAVTFLTNEDELRIAEEMKTYTDEAKAEMTAVTEQLEAQYKEADEAASARIDAIESAVLYTKQTLDDSQKAQARTNIGAAAAGYGFGETAAASMPEGDADLALTTGLYRAISATLNVPENCNLIFVQASYSGYIYQTAYCTDGRIFMRANDHDCWESWTPVHQSAKSYEKIATITVAADEDGSLPKHVIFSEDGNGESFTLTDFIIKAYAGFVDGSKSTLYMSVNGSGVIVNGAIGSISSDCRGFSIFFRQEENGFVRVEYTSSAVSDAYYNAQMAIEKSRLIPPISTAVTLPVAKVDLYTETGDTKAWAEGSTFELWGIRA